MEFYKYVALWIFYNFTYGSNAINIKCRRQNNCSCTELLHHIEYSCPDEYTPTIGIQVKTEYDEVKINCFENLNWHNQELPLLEIASADYFRFRQCTFPTNHNTSFIEIMNRLKLNNAKELKFDYTEDVANITLTADCFKGLHNLEKLILNYDNINADAFQSLDKLIELDLGHNEIQLRNGLFKDLSKLQLLSLDDNNLSRLPYQIFQNLIELQRLGLSFNSINTISSTLFKNLRNLKILQLMRNLLEDLPGNVFYYLENIEKIDMSSNKLQNIPENLFKNNKLLKRVTLKRNTNLTYLPNNLFANLTKLEHISFSECNLTNLPNNLFEGSIHLQNIYFEWNKIEHIPENIFRGLEGLQNLDLSYNKIGNLSNGVFFSLTQLKTLNLEGNLLTSLKRELFLTLKNLEILNLKSNNIGFIDINAFWPVYNLKEVILANNYFDLPESDILGVSLFGNNQELQKVDLSNNKITRMDNFLTSTKLQELDFSYNQISYLSFSDVFTLAVPIYINLNNNNITTVQFSEAEVMATSHENLDADSNGGNRRVSLYGNPIDCNCHVYDFVRYFDRSIDPMVPTLVTIEADNLTCSSPNDLRNVYLTKLKPNNLTCSLQEFGIIDRRLTDKCSYRFRPWDKSLIVNCTNSNFTEAPKLILPTQNFYTQTEIYLQRNLLTSGPKQDMGYENVTKLFLSFNNISKITWIPPKLKVLELDNNNISYLNSETLTTLNLSSLTTIALGKNPWSCDCSTLNVKSFLVSNTARKQIDRNTITCRDSEKLLIDLNFDDVCPNNTSLLLGLVTTFSLIALLIALAMALYYRFQQEVKVWLFAHNMFLWFVTENEIDKDKLYDAFISYSHKDEDFVLNKLLPVLEQGPQPYKLCVHIRDWVAGEFISKQIATSVSESRRTIVILSRSFLYSAWGKMEFRTAHKQAINEGRARVILVLYGNIDVSSDLDDELKAYIRTNTYVKWGDPWFWDKLRYAMPHSRNKLNKKLQKTRNITVAISEKLNDNGTSPASNPGSTPPAIENNPLKLLQIKH